MLCHGDGVARLVGVHDQHVDGEALQQRQVQRARRLPPARVSRVHGNVTAPVDAHFQTNPPRSPVHPSAHPGHAMTSTTCLNSRASSRRSVVKARGGMHDQVIRLEGVAATASMSSWRARPWRRLLGSVNIAMTQLSPSSVVLCTTAAAWQRRISASTALNFGWPTTPHPPPAVLDRRQLTQGSNPTTAIHAGLHVGLALLAQVDEFAQPYRQICGERLQQRSLHGATPSHKPPNSGHLVIQHNVRAKTYYNPPSASLSPAPSSSELPVGEVGASRTSRGSPRFSSRSTIALIWVSVQWITVPGAEIKWGIARHKAPMRAQRGSDAPGAS